MSLAPFIVMMMIVIVVMIMGVIVFVKMFVRIMKMNVALADDLTDQIVHSE